MREKPRRERLTTLVRPRVDLSNEHNFGLGQYLSHLPAVGEIQEGGQEGAILDIGEAAGVDVICVCSPSDTALQINTEISAHLEQEQRTEILLASPS